MRPLRSRLSRISIRPALLACALTLAATPATAQAQDGPRRVCFFGRPLPTCESFVYAQGSFYPRIERYSDLDPAYEWEFSLMRNSERATATGVALALGTDGNGVRAAVKGRYRHWIGRYLAVDVAVGPATASRDREQPTAYTTVRAYGVTGDVTLGLTDWVQLGVRGDMLWSSTDRGPATASYGTVRLGTAPGVLLSAAVLAALAAIYGAV